MDRIPPRAAARPPVGFLLPILAAAAALTAVNVPAPSRAVAGGSSSGPPQAVRKSWPAGGLEGIRSDPVTIQFRKPVDLSSLTVGATPGQGTFRLFEGAAPPPGEPERTPVAGTFSLAVNRKGRPLAKQVVFTPLEPLGPGTVYTLTLGEGVTSDRGAGMEDTFTFSFGTAGDKPTGDITPLDDGVRLVRAPKLGPPPKVTFTFPDVGLANVYSDEVRIRFNRPMSADTMNAATIQLLQGETPVPGTVTFPLNGNPREVRFLPVQPLYPASNYVIRVTREARTEKGRAMRTEFRGAFGTSPFKEGVRPVLAEDFTPGPWMHVGRAFHTASPLPGGDVLVAGGQTYDGTALASAEIYRRAADSFEVTTDLSVPRRKHAAVVLKDGRVLVCGGFGFDGETTAAVEIYEPSSGFWFPAASMAEPRANHTATLLPNGKVFVAGGYKGGAGGLSYATTHEIFNPATGTWSAGPAPVARRGGHTATLLASGNVLLTGGAQFADRVAEVYDPVKGTVARTAGDPGEHRLFHGAALTKAGTVLLAGGGPGPAEIYDPGSGLFHPAGAAPVNGLPTVESAYYSTLTTIPGGRVALIGGLAVGGAPDGGDLVIARVQLWDSGAGGGFGAFFPMLFDLSIARAAHTATPLPDGTYLLVGGLGSNGEQFGNERRTTIFNPSQ